MMERTAEVSPRLKARVAGVFYLLTIVAGVFALFSGDSLVVSGNATATTTNILAHQPLFLSAFTANLIGTACYIVVTAFFYDLFRPVNGSLSLLAAFFSLVGCAIGAFSCLSYLAPLAVSGGGQYLSVFTVEQVHALAYMFLKLNGQAYGIGLVFFGFYCALIGYLIFRSTFLPRVLGVLMALTGLGWLTFLSPPFAKYLSDYLPIVGILGEGSLTLWLLAFGVNPQRWNEQAAGGNKV